MLDIKLIRENPELIKKDLLRRPNFDNTIVDEVVKAPSKVDVPGPSAVPPHKPSPQPAADSSTAGPIE